MVVGRVGDAGPLELEPGGGWTGVSSRCFNTYNRDRRRNKLFKGPRETSSDLGIDYMLS